MKKDKKEYPPLWKQLRNVALVIFVLLVLPSIKNVQGVIRLLALGMILWGLFTLNQQHRFTQRIQPYMGRIIRLTAFIGVIIFIAYIVFEPNPQARFNAFLLVAIIIGIVSIFLIDYAVRTHGRVFRAEATKTMRLAALLSAILFFGFSGVLLYTTADNVVWVVSCIVLGFVLLMYSLGATTIIEPLNEIEESPPKDVGEAIRFFLKRLMN